MLAAENSLWSRCLRELQAELPDQQFNTWIRPLQAIEENQVLRLLAPNRFVVDWLQEHHVERILELVDGVSSGVEVVIEVGSRAGPKAVTSSVDSMPPAWRERKNGRRRARTIRHDEHPRPPRREPGRGAQPLCHRHRAGPAAR